MQKIKNYINGELTEPAGKNYLDNINPATGEVYSLIPDSDERDVQLAVDAAKAAFPSWSVMPVAERSDILLKISQLIDKNLDRLALAESIDQGKPVWLAKRMDIPRARDNFHFYATGAIHMSTEAHATENSSINYTLRQPIGIAGCISPWNLPLYLFTWKIAPALASGNCVIAKPSEITPMTAYLLSELCIEAGLPEGVLNIVHGMGPKAGAAIIQHPKIPAISFTGGTKTGEWIAKTAAPMFKKLSLELGGKNPNMVFADCNFEEAVKTSVTGAFSNQGEICLTGSRIFIEKPLYEKFKDAFLKRVSTLTVDEPLDDNSRMEGIVSKQQMEKVLSSIELAIQAGGKILCGGNQLHLSGKLSKGYYIEPTAIEGLPYDCRTNQEEIFGPVVTLMPFEKEEEALKYANSTTYGLAGTIWTENLSRAHRMAAQLQSGIIWINCWLFRDLRTPFGGMNNSGVGREGGFEALKFFTEEKNVCIKL